MDIKAVDLFCGVGGLTHGLKRAGVDVKMGVDIDPACKYPYEANNEAVFLLKSVDEVMAEDIIDCYDASDIKLLAGCAPCQTFSTYNQKACQSDKRWWLLLQFGRLVEEIVPDLVTMENVPGLKDQNVFQEFVDKLHDRGYYTHFKVIDSSLYGLPQKRRRLVLLASRLGEVRMLTPEELNVKPKKVVDVISKLPTLKAGEVDPNDPLHQSSSLSPLNLRRIRHSKPGGTWRDWPEELVAECHKKESGKTYPGVYARMEWDKPAPTMTTQYFGFGNGRFGHPEQDRAISLREGAIFQGFPKDYKFVPPGASVKKKELGRMIGNAVPVTLGEAIGRSLLRHVEECRQDKKDIA